MFLCLIATSFNFVLLIVNTPHHLLADTELGDHGDTELGDDGDGIDRSFRNAPRSVRHKSTSVIPSTDFSDFCIIEFSIDIV